MTRCHKQTAETCLEPPPLNEQIFSSDSDHLNEGETEYQTSERLLSSCQGLLGINTVQSILAVKPLLNLRDC